MRDTNLNIRNVPKPLLIELKLLALRRGVTLRELVINVMQNVMANAHVLKGDKGYGKKQTKSN